MKRLSLVLALVLACILLLSACGNGTCPMERRNSQKMEKQETSSAYHKITAEEAKEMMDKGDGLIIVQEPFVMRDGDSEYFNAVVDRFNAGEVKSVFE